MKNRRFELRRRLARQYHRNKRGDRFVQGILVRHCYDEFEPDALSWWDSVQFILGGRRVLVAWRHPRHVYQEMIDDAAMKAEFSVMPSFKVEMVSWCRFVKIVAPIEVRHVEELRMLAKLVLSILKGETTLEQEFPGYMYGKAQWVSEGLADQPLGIVSHRIAGT